MGGIDEPGLIEFHSGENPYHQVRRFSGGDLMVANQTSVISSGIASLDSALNKGGLKKGSIVIVIGDASSRKDLFGYHFLYSGLMNGEKVLFFDVEASSDEIMEIFEEGDRKTGELEFIDACPEYSKFFINAVPAKIIERLKNVKNIDRVLINPLTFFVEKFGIQDTGDFLIRIRDIAMKKKLVIVLLMADILSDLEMQSIIDKCDGIIELDTSECTDEEYHTINIHKFGYDKKHLNLTYVVRDERIRISIHERII
jgi:KaiC/GvpD/RAD55 family RecA-like ATPase